MTPDDRLYRAIDGHVPDRVPVVPKIWVDLAARLTGTDLLEVIADPFTALRVIGQAGRMCRADAVRQFHFPRRRVQQSGGRVGEVDSHRHKIGEIDMQGGVATRLSDSFDFPLGDPAFAAYHHFRSCNAPIVKGTGDARRVARRSEQGHPRGVKVGDDCGVVAELLMERYPINRLVI